MLHGVVRTDAEIEVVLERHTDEFGQGVLRRFGQLQIAFVALLSPASRRLSLRRRQGERVAKTKLMVARPRCVAEALGLKAETGRKRSQCNLLRVPSS